MSPEIAPPTTDIENPFTDAEIATRILLDPEEYGADWQLFSNYKAVTLDAALAEQIEGCARFAEIVFESGAGPGVTASRWFHAPPGRSGAMSQYVVVLATEAAAVAMFDATVDPDFRSECFVPYVELAADPTGYCCDPTVPFAAALGGDPVASTKTLGANDIDFRAAGGTWTDAAGVVHTEVVDAVTVRVGRTIIVLEGLRVDEFGQPVLTEEQFDRAIATASERSLHALGGVNHSSI